MNAPADKHPITRPDLSASFLVRWLISILAGVLVFAAISGLTGLSPASPAGQLLGIAGAILLLMPLVFSIMKRVAGAASPPTWFVVHVLCAGVGLVLVAAHAAGGQWLSPPALIFLAALFLVVQGSLARVFLGTRLGDLFAASTGSFNHGETPAIDRQALKRVIESKRLLLQSLSPQDNEGTFSVTVSHWCRRPVLSWRYAALAREEQQLVGARQRAGRLLTLWRPLHMLVAAAFLVGMLIHVVVVLFFAGYVAGDNPITWWHITDWGRP
jgi:hypothetical protein